MEEQDVRSTSHIGFLAFWTRRHGVLTYVDGILPSGPHARGMFFIVELRSRELIELTWLIDVGQVRAVVQAVFPLFEARAASEQGLSGHQRREIVLGAAG